MGIDSVGEVEQINEALHRAFNETFLRRGAEQGMRGGISTGGSEWSSIPPLTPLPNFFCFFSMD